MKMLKRLSLLTIAVSMGLSAIPLPGHAEDGQSVPHRRWSGNRPQEMQRGSEQPKPSDYEGLAHKGGSPHEGQRGAGEHHSPPDTTNASVHEGEPGMHNVSDDHPPPPTGKGGPPPKHHDRDHHRDYPSNNATPGEMKEGND